MRGISERLRALGGSPVSAAGVTFFRIAFGIAMAVNVLFYFPDLVHDYYIEPELSFGYPPLDFIEPLPAFGMYAVFLAQIAAGLLIAVGLWYRWAAAAFFVLTTYVFLIESTAYQNHEYLISLVAFLFIFLPLDGMWSLDARRRPEKASSRVPRWVVWLLRFQIGVPYFYGGLAKFGSDWLAGEPLRMWLGARTDHFLIGPLLGAEPVVMGMAIGGLIFDLTIVPLLLYRRTRPFAFAVVVAFHLTNAVVYGLFIFPWLMIAATTIFFEPDWPESALAWLRRRRDGRAAPAPPGPGGAPPNAPAVRARGAAGVAARMSPLLVIALVVWAGIQLTVPLRHYTIPGAANWTEEGHRFAWHMRLRDKRGEASFRVVRSDGSEIEVDPSTYLTSRQTYRLPGYPERIVLFSRYLSDLHQGAEVYADTAVSLNGRPRAPIVDPDVDLASVSLPLLSGADWILPLEVDLPERP